MKKILVLFLIAVLLGVMFCAVGCQKTWEPTVYETVLDVGAEAPMTVIHTTDTHMTYYSDADSAELQKQGKKRTKRFENLQQQKLDYVADLSERNGWLIAHTGDFMDFISEKNYASLRSFMACTDCLFTPGNHDTSSGKAETYAKLNEAVGYDVSFQSIVRNGIFFVAIDNSDHKMSADQLRSLQQVCRLGQPVVLLVHTPLYTKDLYDLSVANDDAAYLMAVPEELMTSYPQNRYEEQKADESTLLAYDYILNQPNIKAILCGHLHFDYVTQVGSIPQYVGGLDSVRFITFK